MRGGPRGRVRPVGSESTGGSSGREKTMAQGIGMRMLGGASIAALTIALAGTAQAQTKSATAAAAAPAAGTQVEELVVTGFRGSLVQALEVKRTATVAQDSILAEDI